MTYYRLYFLAKNKIRGFEEIHAAEDSIAIERARALSDGSAMELWCKDRRVHLFPPSDAGSPSSPSAALAGKRGEGSSGDDRPPSIDESPQP